MIDDVLTCWPDYPPYGGAYGDDVTPHLTVSSTAEGSELDELLSTVRGQLPITVRAERISVLEVSAGRCVTRKSIRLGGKR